MLLPIVLLITVFFAALFSTLIMSFWTFSPGKPMSIERTFTLYNYIDFLTTPAYIKVLSDTMYISIASTILGVLAAYPIAYSIARSESFRTRKILLALILMVFLMSTVARLYAIIEILGNYGVINIILQQLGFPPIHFINTPFAVIIGGLHWTVPLAVLSLIGPIQLIDPSLGDAAQILGANKFQTFMKITLPLSIPGITAAIALCFAGGVAMFVTPMMLGGGLVDMMSNRIYYRFQGGGGGAVNYPAGSAMAAILLLISIAISYLINRVLTRRLRVS